MTDLFSSKVQLLDLFADSVLAIETDFDIAQILISFVRSFSDVNVPIMTFLPILLLPFFSFPSFFLLSFHFIFSSFVLILFA